MPPRFIIEIKPHRYGWLCEEPFGAPRVFVLRPHAIQFAQHLCTSAIAEIRVRDRNGVLEQTLRVEPRQQQHVAA